MWIEATEARLKNRYILSSEKIEIFGTSKLATNLFTIVATTVTDCCYNLGSFDTMKKAEAALDRLVAHLANGALYYKITDTMKD